MGNSEANSNNNQQTFTGKGKFINVLLRSLMSLIGIAILSMGATFLKQSGLGLDPFTAMNIGFSNLTHIPLGTFQLAMNFILFIFVFLLDRKQIGIGTIFNMVLVGYEIEWFSVLYKQFLFSGSNPYVVIVDVVSGLLLFTLGTAIYMSTNLGASPYDAIAPIISSRFHAKYQWIRSIQDISIMVIAFFAHGAVGILTLVIAFFAGPLINFWMNSVAHQIMYHIDHFSSAPTIKNAGQGISGLGKYGYSLLQYAYHQTNMMEQHMSGYSDEDLLNLIQKTKMGLKRTKHLQQNLTYRYQSLRSEAKRRHLNLKAQDIQLDDSKDTDDDNQQTQN